MKERAEKFWLVYRFGYNGASLYEWQLVVSNLYRGEIVYEEVFEQLFLCLRG